VPEHCVAARVWCAVLQEQHVVPEHCVAAREWRAVQPE
jgi:hypothetical protein